MEGADIALQQLDWFDGLEWVQIDAPLWGMSADLQH